MTEMATKSFASAVFWRRWIDANHATSGGIWLRIHKKGSGKKTVTYAEALDEALCYGWIDGQKNKGDESSWLQKFTPRRPRSIWSKKNCEHATRLIKTKRMTAGGQKEVDAAKKDGRWDKAYDAASTMEIPTDFLRELKKDKRALSFFESLNRANLFAIVWRLQTAKKPETRTRRMDLFLQMMRDGKNFH
jgi:uncharacterized protein YdeI (YjbR/CyaY-like superfamily)